MIKSGSGRVLVALIIGLFIFTNIASAKSRGTRTSSKGQLAHRRSEPTQKNRKERASSRQSNTARKAVKDRRNANDTRLAKRSGKECRTGRHSRLARRHREESIPRTTIAFTAKKELPDARPKDNQISDAPRLTPGATVAAAAVNTAQTLKAAEPQPQELENEVIPPAPNIIKRSANTISIPAELAGASSNEKPDAKPESKYEEHAVVSSSVSVGSNFGYRRDPFTRHAKFHAGVDIKAHWGDPVGASQTGVVQFAGWYHGYGNLVIVDHGGGVTTHYAHLSSFDVEPGTRVERGTILGRAGSTGRATSAHLHYEVRLDGAATNPLHPLALDPSSDYFKRTRPTVDAGRASTPAASGSSQEK